jgi:hypothetical protein
MPPLVGPVKLHLGSAQDTMEVPELRVAVLRVLKSIWAVCRHLPCVLHVVH